MTAHEKIARALNRVATFTSVRRTRAKDEQRTLENGEELLARIEDAAARFSEIADRLERSLYPPDRREILRPRRGRGTAGPGRAGQGEARSGRRSQVDRVLDILADGEWHTTAEILRLVPCVLHSRIADARARGLNVECDHTLGVGAESYRYRLAAGPLTDGGMADTSAVSPSVSGSVLDGSGLIPGGDGSTGKGRAGSIEPLQLTFGEAA